MFLNEVISFLILHPVLRSELGIICGALTGATYYVLTNKAISKALKFILFIISFVAGVISADFVADLLSVITPQNIEVKASLGAMVSSAFFVKTLKVMSNYINEFILRFMSK